MKTLPYTTSNFTDKGILIEDNLFYKIISASRIDVLSYILENKEKLTQELYSLPIDFYQLKDGHYCYSAEFLTDYLTLDDLQYLYLELGSKKLIKQILKMFLELDSIGVLYDDFHTANIMLNKKGNSKLVDLDSASTNFDPRMCILARKNLIDVVLRLIVAPVEFLHAPTLANVFYLFETLNLYELFDEDTVNAIKYIKGIDSKAFNYDIKYVVNSICKNSKEIKRRSLNIV